MLKRSFIMNLHARNFPSECHILQCHWHTSPRSTYPKEYNGPATKWASLGHTITFPLHGGLPWRGGHCMLAIVGSQHWTIVGDAQGTLLGFRGHSWMRLRPFPKFKGSWTPRVTNMSGKELGSLVWAVIPVWISLTPNFLPSYVVLPV